MNLKIESLRLNNSTTSFVCVCGDSYLACYQLKHDASVMLLCVFHLRLQHPALMGKLFGTLKERYMTRPGGYTRVLRAPKRQGDNAQMAVVEFVDNR